MLVETASLAASVALHRRLVDAAPPGLIDVVPAARSVLLVLDPAVLSPAAARAWVEAQAAAPARTPAPGELVEVPIVYDGEDLGDTARLLGLSEDALVARHLGAEWTVAFTGFAPGFGYLTSAEWDLDVPRRASPRSRVPAGAVGLAGGFSGAYPRPTPGGWQLIGRTPAVLFDPHASTPALLRPGMRVRFVHDEATARRSAATGAPGVAADAVEREAAVPSAAMDERAALRVVAPGARSTLQDAGRPARASEGIAVSGAADAEALRRANRLVGNSPAAAGVEVLLGGFRAVAETDLWIALTGASGRGLIDDRPVPWNEAVPWPAGAELALPPFAHGARAYLGVRGGAGGPLIAGSRATDTLAGIGGADLAAGDVIALADDIDGEIPALDIRPWTLPDDGELILDLEPGPRADWFAPEALALLRSATWTVSDAADRVGVRLDGPELVRTRAGELVSEGMRPGALQVPPAGRPVVLGVDGPVTGGYPVIAVATRASLDALAQARPGVRIRFRTAR